MTTQSKGQDSPRKRGKRVGPLTNLGQVITEMGRLYREARKGELLAADASRLASILVGLRQAFEARELENITAQIQAVQNQLSSSPPLRLVASSSWRDWPATPNPINMEDIARGDDTTASTQAAQ